MPPGSASATEIESRNKALRSIGVDVFGHPECPFELHCYRALNKV
jgi:hypothetical protein